MENMPLYICPSGDKSSNYSQIDFYAGNKISKPTRLYRAFGCKPNLTLWDHSYSFADSLNIYAFLLKSNS